ncbi:MAG: OmpA family protein [Chitinivibrionales bacterium]|nr:OmpA family protein [Chitinivibrionales bacterium]MBD3394149.1 OmpA family protein [Chitinivibrionales bacterium]
MMNSKFSSAYVVVLAWGVAFASFAAEKAIPYDAGMTDLKTRLAKALAAHQEDGSVLDAGLATQALARLEAAEAFLAGKPKDKKAPKVFASCSLLVETALVELALREEQQAAADLQDKLNETLSELNAVRESISNIERGQASKLKAALDAEKEKARKLREEAERRFNDLQSELISVKQDARGTIISMSDILFAVDKADLTPDLKTNLAKIAGILTVFRTSKVIVEGHTDNQGGEEYNLKLSERRAENVMNFLIEQGVDASRLTSVGYGFSRPVADNSTREGRQKNRRVDLVIQDASQRARSEEKGW